MNFMPSCIVAIALSIWSCQLVASTLTFVPDKSSALFKATGTPSALVIKGHGEGVNGQWQLTKTALSGSVSFPIQNLTTEMTLRDKHMKEKYLEVEKFPHASFTPTKLPWTAAPTLAVNKGEFAGKLQLHGVEKPVQGMVTATQSGNQVEAEFTFHLKMSDFNIATPSFAEITVAEDVDVTVKAVMTVQEP